MDLTVRQRRVTRASPTATRDNHGSRAETNSDGATVDLRAATPRLSRAPRRRKHQGGSSTTVVRQICGTGVSRHTGDLHANPVQAARRHHRAACYRAHTRGRHCPPEQELDECQPSHVSIELSEQRATAVMKDGMARLCGSPRTASRNRSARRSPRCSIGRSPPLTGSSAVRMSGRPIHILR